MRSMGMLPPPSPPFAAPHMEANIFHRNSLYFIHPFMSFSSHTSATALDLLQWELERVFRQEGYCFTLKYKLAAKAKRALFRGGQAKAKASSKSWNAFPIWVTGIFSAGIDVLFVTKDTCLTNRSCYSQIHSAVSLWLHGLGITHADIFSADLESAFRTILQRK